MRERGFGISILTAAAATFVGVYKLAPLRTATPPASSAPAEASSVYYSGCNEARAAGAAPIYRGQPGYRPEMDGDDDGIACEPHRSGF